MTSNTTGDYMPALLISLVLLASIICGLVFVICAVVLCKFCYQKQKVKNGKVYDKNESVRNRRPPTEDSKASRKLLKQSETPITYEKIKNRSLDLDSDCADEPRLSLNEACVQTDEICFLPNNVNFKHADSPKTTTIPVCKNYSNSYKTEIYTNLEQNQFRNPHHSKSRVKVQIQNYITPYNNSNSLQITQAVVRRYSDNSPFKDDEALEAEIYSRGRSASQIPQSNRMSPAPSIVQINNGNSNKDQCLITPTTQRRGSHHLRPFDTHWGNNKLSHSMELVSCKQIVPTDERKVHSFDNALGKRKAVSSQGGLYQAKSLTISNSDEVASSSMEEHQNQPLLLTNRKENKHYEQKHSSQRFHKNDFPLNEGVVYNLTEGYPFKQRSYQNIMEFPNRDNYKSRKSYVGEFTANPESPYDNRIFTKNMSPQRERRIYRRARGSSSRTQSSKDSITINIIDSDWERSVHNNDQFSDHRFSINDFYNTSNDISLSLRSAAAKRHQFSRERQSLIQVGDITEFQKIMESNSKIHSSRDSDNWNNQKHQFLERDYSIDERTSAIFNEFMRPDPRLDKDVMKAQILEKIRTQKHNIGSPVKNTNQTRLKLEHTKAASFAGKDDFQDLLNSRDDDSDYHLKFPKSSSQQRRQSIGKLKVQSFDQRVQLPVIILPEDSP